jgi:signal transduction histidine kinase
VSDARPDRIRYGGQLLALVAIYWATAKLGLSFDALAGVATTVWPPTGIAIAALVLGGRRLWPAVFVGAVLVNAATGIPSWATLIIATGNTLEALAAAELLRRWRFRRRMDRVYDVFLLGAVALTVTMISATFGTAAIRLAHIPIKDGYGLFWSVWWVGDVLGALLVAPTVFTWTSDRPTVRQHLGRWIEGTLVLGLIVLVSLIVFHDLLPLRVVLLARGTYSLWPLLIWTAVRFRQPGTAGALLVISFLAISGTAAGHGVFDAHTLHERLFRAQCYMAVTSVSIMTLAAALAERRQAIQARDEFISIASHELKTPLTALRLRLRSAIRWLEPDAAVRRRRTPSGQPAGVAAQAPQLQLQPQPQQTERLERALQAANTITDRLARLIDDLLDVSRLNAQQLVLDIEDVNLDQLLTDVAGRLRDQALDGGSSVALDIARAGGGGDGDGGPRDAPDGPDDPGAPIIGRWDRVRLEQVMTNLLSNAIKYGAGKEIVVSARAADDRVIIDVRDGGIGIAKVDQSRIFFAFERVASVHRVGGLGLGLFIGRQIVEAHGGTLLVSSQPGKGSTFTLELPREAVATATPPADKH